jgi:hypothetical protein
MHIGEYVKHNKDSLPIARGAVKFFKTLANLASRPVLSLAKTENRFDTRQTGE